MSPSCGEPAVVAKVNNDPISAVELEMGVSIMVASQQGADSGPSGIPIPANQTTQMQSPHQIRHDLLDRLIAQRLLLQEGKRLGLTPSVSAAQSMVQQQAQLMKSLQPSDPAYVPIQAYLCVNQLTPDTFASDPSVVQDYSDQLTIGALSRE